MEVPCSFVAVLLVCICLTGVSGNDTKETVTPITARDTNSNTSVVNRHAYDFKIRLPKYKMLSQRMRCSFACMQGKPSARCICPQVKDCETTKCGEKEICTMTFGRFPRCVRDRSICNLPKATVACDTTTRTFYYNKKTGRCEEFTNGECSGNRNVFRMRGDCIRTCGRRSGFFFKKRHY